MEPVTQVHLAVYPPDIPYTLIDRERLLEELNGDRGLLGTLLKLGEVRAAARGVYVFPVLPRYRLVNGPSPSPALVADCLARRNGWRLVVSPEAALHLCGLTERPERLSVFGYNQPTERRYRGFSLRPANPEFASYYPASQCLVVALEEAGDSLTDEQLDRMGQQMAVTQFFRAQYSDLEADWDRLGAKGQHVFSAMLRSLNENDGRSWPLLSPPPDWVPPPVDSACTVDGWEVVELESLEGPTYHLRAKSLRNHPKLGDGRPLVRSSQLIWLDRSSGWARTLSRVYRLGRPAPQN